MKPVCTYAIELDTVGIRIDEKNKNQHFLVIKNIESFYNIRTESENFDLMTSYLATNDGSLFPLYDTSFSSNKSDFRPTKSEELHLDPVSIQTIQNKRKFLYYVIEDNLQSSQNLKSIFGEYLTSVNFTPKLCKERKLKLNNFKFKI